MFWKISEGESPFDASSSSDGRVLGKDHSEYVGLLTVPHGSAERQISTLPLRESGRKRNDGKDNVEMSEMWVHL